jgi:hypothetical protein
MITRRNFIQALGLATFAGTVLNLSGTAFGQTTKSNDFFPIPAEILSDPVLSFTSELFTPFINTDFEIRQESMRRVELLRLLNVKAVERKTNLADGVKGESFSLMFFSPRGAKLKSGQFEFTHFSLGTFTLTISPVSAEPNRYEAVINHLQR